MQLPRTPKSVQGSNLAQDERNVAGSTWRVGRHGVCLESMGGQPAAPLDVERTLEAILAGHLDQSTPS